MSQTLGSCLSLPPYAIFLLALVATTLTKGGDAYDAISQNHVFATRYLQKWKDSAGKEVWPVICCEQKRSRFVAPSCLSFFLSGLLVVFPMTSPLTFL